MKKGSMRMLITSTAYVLFACILLFTTTYAWFIMTNTVNASLVSAISEVEAEYDFYVYRDQWHQGNQQPQLFDQLCTSSSENGCYHLIQDPSQLFLWTQSVAPGERFSFAISIVSIGTEAYLSLDIGKVQSFGFVDEDYQISDAFYYEVVKVSYIVNDFEGPNQIGTYPIVTYQGFFDQPDWTIYPLIHDLPLNHIQGDRVVIVVYFDFYYDPFVFHRDPEGQLYPNHNYLMGQSLAIQDIYMMISSSLE